MLSARVRGIGTEEKEIPATLKYWILDYSQSLRLSMNIHKVVHLHILYSDYDQKSGTQESNFLNSISRFNFEGLSSKISYIFQMQQIRYVLPTILYFTVIFGHEMRFPPRLNTSEN